MRNLGLDFTHTKFLGLPISKPDAPVKPGEFPKELADNLRTLTKSSRRSNTLNRAFAKFVHDGYLINQGLNIHFLSGINSECLKHLAKVTNALLPFVSNIIESLKQPGATMSESDARILKAYTDAATALAEASSSLKSRRLFNTKSQNGESQKSDDQGEPELPRFYRNNPPTDPTTPGKS